MTVNYEEKWQRPKNNEPRQVTMAAFILAILCTFVAAHFMTGGKLAGNISDSSREFGDKVSSFVQRKPTVDENLSPATLYQKAVDFKAAGWVEPSRKACLAAIKKGGTGTSATNARIFMTVALPIHPVTSEMEQGNIEAFNLMSKGKGAEAVSAFRALIQKYPEFEWPYGNLAAMYLEENNVQEAEPLVQKALQINPNYLNGLLYKADLGARKKDLTEVKEALTRARESLQDATDPTFLLPMRDEISARLEKIQLHSGASGST